MGSAVMLYYAITLKIITTIIIIITITITMIIIIISNVNILLYE